MIRMVSIDPGEVHNGVAVWVGARCQAVAELKGAEIYERLRLYMQTEAVDEVVVEDFRLYPDKSKQQHYGQMITVKRIGVIEYICEQAGVPCILQGASIKKPAFKVAAGRGIQVLGSNQHMRDAWVHGYYRITHR